MRYALDRFENLAAGVSQPIAFIGVIGMLVVSGVTIIDVLARWLFNSGVVALNEIVAMTFAVTVAATLPAGLAQSVNVRIDLLEPALKGRWRMLVILSGEILLLVFFVFLAWGILNYSVSLVNDGRTTVIYGWPQSPFFIATTALLVLGVIVQAAICINLPLKTNQAAREEDENNTRGWAKAYVLFLGAALIIMVAWAAYDFDDLSQLARASPRMAVIIGGAVLWLALLALVPLAAILGLVGLAGTALLVGAEPGLNVIATEASGFLTNINVAVLPLFLMMGSFAVAAGISEDVYRLAQAILGSLRGGLALATIAGCAAFGAITGSSLATMATFGRMSLPEMRARGYSPALATGSVAAGGNLGALIPPSGPLILFALLTGVSIGQLFIAAIIPGLVAFAFYSVTVLATIKISPSVVPPRVELESREILGALRQGLAVIVLFVVVMGGIYSGILTANEAAAVGAFSTFVLALVRKKLHWQTFWRVMAETTATTALIYTLIFGGLVFTFFVEFSGLPEILSSLIEDLALGPIAVVGIILLILIGLGCIMDSFTILIVTVPIMTPVVVGLGYDIVWWGIINLAVVELGTLTPPFGTSVFVLRGFARDVPITTIFKGVLPFCAADTLKIIVLVTFPVITLWLPSTMLN